MTTALQPSSADGGAIAPGDAPAEAEYTAGEGPEYTPGYGRIRNTWFARHPAWPITATLVGWPLWWLLGVSNYQMVLIAIPCAVIMYRWRATGTRRLRVPPGFGIWLLFLLVSVIGVSTLSLTAPDTLNSPVSNRLISWALRILTYLGCTVIMLYAGNLSERELPRRKIAWQLGLVGVYTVIGGWMGVLLPAVRLTSPLSYLVPASLTASNQQLVLMLHPSTSQIQNFLGYAEGRPSAPFAYTNMWGNSLAILLPWLFVAWWYLGNRKQRRWTVLIFLAALPPVVYSLDRGLWVGIGLCVLYLALRFALRGKLLMLGALAAVLAMLAAVILFSPLQSLIQDRLAHGKSNVGRTSSSLVAGEAGLASPIVGFGDTRHQIGSASSIAVGKTANCKNCGQSVIGGNGQLQLLLICSGLLGVVLYCGFFAFGVWRYWRDPTPYGVVGVMVFIAGFWFMWVYETAGPPLIWAMLGYALLWRNDRERRLEALAAAEPERPAAPAADTGQQRAITWVSG